MLWPHLRHRCWDADNDLTGFTSRRKGTLIDTSESPDYGKQRAFCSTWTQEDLDLFRQFTTCFGHRRHSKGHEGLANESEPPQNDVVSTALNRTLRAKPMSTVNTEIEITATNPMATGDPGGEAQGRPIAVCIIDENATVPPDRRVWQEALALAEAGYRVSVICPKGQGFSSSRETIEGIDIYRHPAWQAETPLGYLIEYGWALVCEFFLALECMRTPASAFSTLAIRRTQSS